MALNRRTPTARKLHLFISVVPLFTAVRYGNVLILKVYPFLSRPIAI